MLGCGGLLRGLVKVERGNETIEDDILRVFGQTESFHLDPDECVDKRDGGYHLRDDAVGLVEQFSALDREFGLVCGLLDDRELGLQLGLGSRRVAFLAGLQIERMVNRRDGASCIPNLATTSFRFLDTPVGPFNLVADLLDTACVVARAAGPTGVSYVSASSTRAS